MARGFLFAAAIALAASAYAQQAQSPQPVSSPQQTATPALTDSQIKFYADMAVKTAQAFERAKHQARQAAQAYEQIAEMRCRQSMANDPEYRDATRQRDSAQRVLTEAHQLNNAQLAVDASSQYNKAAEEVKQIEERVMASDADVKAARAVLAEIDPPPPAPVIIHSPPQQVASAKPADPAPKPAPANAPPKHRTIPTRIEIGMTRDDLMWYLHRNSENYRITQDNASRPVNGSVEQVKVQSQNAEASTVNGQSGSRTDQGVGSRRVETTVVSNKTEHMTLQVLQWRSVIVGQQRDVLGGWHPVSARQLVPVGQVNVTLVDDVVTGVDGAVQ